MNTAEALLAWDVRRPRTMQAEFGMSGLGGCERRAKYELTGTEKTDPSGSIAAVLGTLVHEGVADVLKQLRDEGLIYPDDLIESSVEFAGMPGHIDHYDARDAELVDTKSVASYRLDTIKAQGIGRSWKFQTAVYAAALIKQGYTVKTIRIDVIDRSSGELWQDRRPFDPAEVQEAFAWLNHVRYTSLAKLERPYDSDSAWCRGCPFFTACWGYGPTERKPGAVRFVDDPDAARWAAQLEQARADAADAKRRADEARDALDYLRPNDTGKSDPVAVPGFDKALQFTVKVTNRTDTAAVKARYAELGETVPTKPSTSVEVKLVEKPEVAL